MTPGRKLRCPYCGARQVHEWDDCPAKAVTFYAPSSVTPEQARAKVLELAGALGRGMARQHHDAELRRAAESSQSGLVKVVADA